MSDPKPTDASGYEWSADSGETSAGTVTEATAGQGAQPATSAVVGATPAESVQASTSTAADAVAPEDSAQGYSSVPYASQPPGEPRPQPASSVPTGPRPTPADYLIGGTRLLSATVATWRETEAATLDEALLELEEGRTVLLPQSQWEAVYGPLEGNRARYATIGLALGATAASRSTGKRFLRTADAIVDRFIAPVYNSWLMAPIRRPIERLVDAGEARVDEWAAVGQAREQRSVLLTQASARRLFNETVQVINEGPIVQQLVQDVVRAQSQSLTRSFLDEVREYTVTLDLTLEYRLRRLLGQSPYPTHTTPSYSVTLRGQPFDLSMLGDRPYLGGQFAGFVSRATAFAVDIFVVVFILTIAGMFYTALRDIFFLDRFFDALVGADTMTTIRSIVAALAAFVVAVGYWLIAWMVTGETLGHALMGVRVIHRDGERLNLWQALRRLLGYFLSALPLGLGFLWVLIDNRRDGWHDKIAGSDAVYIWHARPDETFLSRQVAQVYQGQKIQNTTAQDGA